MIKATIITRGEKLSLKVEGHAGYAEEGKDIVCASASILAHTVAHKVDLLNRFNAFIEPAVIRLESGDTEITCVPPYHLYSVCRSIFEFAGTGFCLLAQSYPQYVEIIDTEKD